MVKVLIAGGGTGGHVYPMVAVANALRAERADAEVIFVGTARGIENRVIPAEGGRLELLDILPLRGRGLGGFLRGSGRAATAVVRARALVKKLQPDVVFSVGGYAAGPVALAAWSCGVPLTLLEPNSVPGFTNRLLRPLVDRAYVCFPETKDAFDERCVRWTGVPLRKRFEAVDYRSQASPLSLLVMGGSQGALALNETVPQAIAHCARAGMKLRVRHQTGRDKDEQVKALYAELGIQEQLEVTAFIDDVAGALAEADLVIERAGAGSLAELCAVGRPAILIPYPHAADDHQRKNAESLQRDDGAVCLVQSQATVKRLSTELEALIRDDARRERMAAAAAKRGRPDAARTIACDLLALATASKDGRTSVSRRSTETHSEQSDGDVRRVQTAARLEEVRS